ncbi:hypothetical protein KIL84_019897 [Mauremys mutica]|uniref:Uncharacterized protein n=1 Tax=Mauremys mutica TaxID=74926 RepID=A0A9D3XXF9_9SAUR|nr:hypothetical protein KIL84_019897 [Mauremys mutica]
MLFQSTRFCFRTNCLDSSRMNWGKGQSHLLALLTITECTADYSKHRVGDGLASKALEPVLPWDSLLTTSCSCLLPLSYMTLQPRSIGISQERETIMLTCQNGFVLWSIVH